MRAASLARLTSSRFFFPLITLIGLSVAAISLSLFISRSETYAVPSLTHQAAWNHGQATSSATGTSTASSTEGLGYDFTNYCIRYPDPGNIAIVIKTGATELHSKVPGLLSILRCVSNPIIVSDLEQRLGAYPVHDVLSRVKPVVKDQNQEFQLYHLQQNLSRSGRLNEIPRLRNVTTASEDWRTKGKSAAWALDLYKFLHMIDRSWEVAPRKDWYFFLEADTFLNWPDFLGWLRTQDPNQKSYFGHAVQMWEAPYDQPFYFAHGGAGILLSGLAVHEFAVTHAGLANRWDGRVAKMWFGDYVLAAALHEELQLHVADLTPSMTEKDPPAIVFDSKKWCHSIISLHHMPLHLSDRLVRRRNANSTLLYKDVYHEAFPIGFPDHRANWDNVIEDESANILVIGNSQNDSEPSEKHITFAECEKECQKHETCVQFSLITTSATKLGVTATMGSDCRLSQAFMLGRERQPETNDDDETHTRVWTSGWMPDRIVAWTKSHQDCQADGDGAPP